ncbi:MAG: phosphatidylcholine/phosphatidylserine synthase [Planctomycetota bacterium]|nr:phosphatidylcholine/phosphatidylserine synthase [Planctomycetota bacterium]MDA1105580.1 phosphatidylcholine/phosphatidylserine synthase [Planctomycetota bacterium]
MNPTTEPPPQHARRRLFPLRGFRRPLPAIGVMPTIMTLGNLVCGFAAIHYASKPVASTGFQGWSTLTVAATLVFVGMFFDAIDGFVARLTRTASEFGAQLDSMADMVTFGVAPAIMMLRLVSHYFGSDDTAIFSPDAQSTYAKATWGIAGLYICCTALRLARFNAETVSLEAEGHRYFRGLPSPGAAGLVVSLIILHQHLVAQSVDGLHGALERFSSLAIPAGVLVAGLLMVSRIGYPHFVNRYLRGRRDFATVARIVLPIPFLVWYLQESLAVAFVVYALSGPVMQTWAAMRRTSSSDPRGARSPS